MRAWLSPPRSSWPFAGRPPPSGRRTRHVAPWDVRGWHLDHDKSWCDSLRSPMPVAEDERAKRREGRCAVTDLAVPELLRAGHIKAWADCEPDGKRLDVCQWGTPGVKSRRSVRPRPRHVCGRRCGGGVECHRYSCPGWHRPRAPAPRASTRRRPPGIPPVAPREVVQERR